MNDRERRLKYAEEVLKRSLEKNQESGNQEILNELITDPVFLRALQEAEENTIKGRPEKEKLSVEDLIKDPEFNQELQRILKRIDGEK